MREDDALCCTRCERVAENLLVVSALKADMMNTGEGRLNRNGVRYKQSVKVHGTRRGSTARPTRKAST